MNFAQLSIYCGFVPHISFVQVFLFHTRKVDPRITNYFIFLFCTQKINPPIPIMVTLQSGKYGRASLFSLFKAGKSEAPRINLDLA